MGYTKYPNGVSSFGMPVIGKYATTGSVFFVDSTTGSNGNSGADPDNPFADIDYAIGKCTASKGDIIFVMPNHAETLTTAAGIVFDVAGVACIGLGSGTDRPSITLGTTEACDVDVSADNVMIENMYFDMTGITAIVSGIDVDGANFLFYNNEILMSDGTGQAVEAIHLGACADGARILANRISGPDNGGDIAIHPYPGCDKFEIAYNWIDGDFDTACIGNTGAACIGLSIHHNTLKNDDTNIPAIDIGATSVASYGLIFKNAYNLTDDTAIAAERVAHGKCKDFENYGGGAEKTSGMLLPAVESTSDVRLKTSIVYL